MIIATAGTGICFVLNAVSFLAVLAALAFIRTDELHEVERDPSARVIEARDGRSPSSATTPSSESCSPS